MTDQVQEPQDEMENTRAPVETGLINDANAPHDTVPEDESAEHVEVPVNEPEEQALLEDHHADVPPPAEAQTPVAPLVTITNPALVTTIQAEAETQDPHVPATDEYADVSSFIKFGERIASGNPSVTGVYTDLAQYIREMKPGRYIEENNIVFQQGKLFRTIRSIIENFSAEEFQTLFTDLLSLFREHSNGVFGLAHIYRGAANWRMTDEERALFQRLLTMLTVLREPGQRELSLRTIDMNKTLAAGLTEEGRQRVLAYFGV